MHGHQVGGTNPSLVEALGAGCAVLAHSNPFNRWVAGSGAQYFSDEMERKEKLDKLLADPSICLQMKEASKIRFDEEFRWGEILAKYEKLLLRWVTD